MGDEKSRKVYPTKDGTADFLKAKPGEKIHVDKDGKTAIIRKDGK